MDGYMKTLTYILAVLSFVSAGVFSVIGIRGLIVSISFGDSIFSKLAYLGILAVAAVAIVFGIFLVLFMKGAM